MIGVVERMGVIGLILMGAIAIVYLVLLGMHIFLSLHKSKKAGMIIPIISLVLSILFAVSININQIFCYRGDSESNAVAYVDSGFGEHTYTPGNEEEIEGIVEEKVGSTLAEPRSAESDDTTYVINDDELENEVDYSADSNEIKLTFDAQVLFLALLRWNIPTAIYVLIYFVCRNSVKKKADLSKMKIKDL